MCYRGSRDYAMVLGGLFMLSLLFWGCGGGLKSSDYYDKIQPLADLPQPVDEDNFVVEINNVADIGTSFENWAELYVNDKKIALGDDVIGFHEDYYYHFRLKIGVYDVKAYYYDGKDKYEISTEDKSFRIYPDRRTILSITLDKKLDGALKYEKNFFDESYQPLKNANMPPAGGEQSVAEPARSSNTFNSQQLSQPHTTSQTRAQAHSINFTNGGSNQNIPRNEILLQINTTPVKASVKVDGKLVGQSPLSLRVDRRRNHIVQFSKQGYNRKTKVLTVQNLKNKNSLVLNERLER